MPTLRFQDTSVRVRGVFLLLLFLLLLLLLVVAVLRLQLPHVLVRRLHVVDADLLEDLLDEEVNK